jgi:translation initiation factor 2A
LPPGAAPGGGVSLTADGDENLSKAALKNKKKREAKKAKEAEAKATALAAPAENGTPEWRSQSHSPERRDRARSQSKSGYQGSRPHSRKREGSRQRGPPINTSSPTPKQQAVTNGKPVAPPAAEASQPAPELTVTSPGAGSPHEKKIRSLLKKLRAIDDLKMRQAGGEKLEGTQVLKIGTEVSVRQDLAELGFTEG